MSRFFAFLLIAVTLFYLWPVQILVGPQRSIGSAVILFNLLLCLEYHRRYSKTSTDWGWDGKAFPHALSVCILITLPVVTFILLTGRGHSNAPIRGFSFATFLGLFLWALAQQFALQTVLLREMRRVLARTGAITATAALFSFLHLPNPFLVVATFIGGWIWCWMYSRYPHLVPLALSHSLSSLAILSSFPRGITGGMRVGYSYFLLGN